MRSSTMKILSLDLRPIFKPEPHRPIPCDFHLVNDRQPELFVKLRDGERTVLYSLNEAFEGFTFAEAFALLRFQLH